MGVLESYAAAPSANTVPYGPGTMARGSGLPWAVGRGPGSCLLPFRPFHDRASPLRIALISAHATPLALATGLGVAGRVHFAGRPRPAMLASEAEPWREEGSSVGE